MICKENELEKILALWPFYINCVQIQCFSFPQQMFSTNFYIILVPRIFSPFSIIYWSSRDVIIFIAVFASYSVARRFV